MYNYDNNATAVFDWMKEGLGYYLSFEIMGSNTVSCTNFVKTHYANGETQGKQEKLEPTDSFRDHFKKLAKKAPSIEIISPLHMKDIREKEVAKAWALFDYILKYDQEVGQDWLSISSRAKDSEASGSHNGLNVNEWRNETADLFNKNNVKFSGNPLAHFFKQWKRKRK